MESDARGRFVCHSRATRMKGDEVKSAFNDAINFALDEAGPEGLTFLAMWREGAWDEIAAEFPVFKSGGTA